MEEASSTGINEVLSISILKQIVSYISNKNEPPTQKEIICKYSGPPEAKESEIRKAINWGIQQKLLKIELKQPRDLSLLSITDEKVRQEFTNNIDIVISIPILAELGLDRVKTRNKMIETRDAFKRIITSAQRILRISSPFFERNILDNDGLPEIKQLFINAFERGCKIKILSREIFLRRSPELIWIKELVKNNGYSPLLSIFDYHLESARGGIISSTHSKMIIADVSIAYVGSGELRKNSLANNFEIGCLIQGPIVSGLCEAFDLMTSYSKEW